jgi:undecaprenyl pyrophosphate phosphatase UppP
VDSVQAIVLGFVLGNQEFLPMSSIAYRHIVPAGTMS